MKAIHNQTGDIRNH